MWGNTRTAMDTFRTQKLSKFKRNIPLSNNVKYALGFSLSFYAMIKGIDFIR